MIACSERIDQILAELEDLTGGGDPETAHALADRLPLEAIDLLCRDNGYLDLGAEIGETFKRITKWYA